MGENQCPHCGHITTGFELVEYEIRKYVHDRGLAVKCNDIFGEEIMQEIIAAEMPTYTDLL